MRTALVFLLALLTCLVSAIDLRGIYVPPGGDIYGVTAQTGPVDLQPAFNAATAAWNAQIADPWNFDIKYGWSDTIGGALAQYYGWWFPFGDGRHFQGRVLFNPNFNWYGGLDPEGLTTSAFDLLTVATHEVGHSMIGIGPRWTNEIADGDIDITAPRRFAGASFAASGEHIVDATALMSPFLAPGERKGITFMDLDTAMQTQTYVHYGQPVDEKSTLLSLFFGVALFTRRKLHAR